MFDFQLTIKNYRCFSQDDPLRMQVSSGLTALVGPNNAGKSSFLKFFHETKNLWNLLAQTERLPLLTSERFGVDYLDVFDESEVFCDENSAPITIEVEISTPSSVDAKANGQWLSKIVLQAERSNPKLWSSTIFIGADFIKLPTNSALKYVAPGVANSAAIPAFDVTSAYSILTALTNVLYLPPFRNAITEGTGSHYGLYIGTAFINIWNEWKTGGVKSKNRAAEGIVEDIRRIFNYRSLDIAASPQLKTLSISVNGKPYKLREMGAGITQFIIALGNAAVQQPELILVDEPELNLHPTLQIDFLTALAAYAKAGTIFATHSIGLSRATADRIYSFVPSGTTTSVRPLEKTPSYAEFVGELSFSSFRELGFNKLLLVEGVTEVRTIQQLLRKLKKDHEILLLPLGGSGLINTGTEYELQELKRITDLIYVLIDSEKSSADDPGQETRTAFLDMCARLGFTCHATVRKATENYLSDNAIKAVKGEKYRALGPYEPLSNPTPTWAKQENWRIANAMEYTDFKDTDLGEFLARI